MTEDYYILVTKLACLRDVELLLNRVFPLDEALTEALRIVQYNIRSLEDQVQKASKAEEPS